MNVAASADVRMTGGSGEEIHFHFASRSTDTRLECIFRGRGYDDILCNRRVDGSDAWTGSLPLPISFDLNSTYRIRAEWENNTVTFWIGTNDLIRAGSFTVSAGLSDGLFGLCTYRTAAIFDNVSIEPLVGRPSLTHTFGLGTNLVTLTAYDTDGQAATGAVTLVMQPGDTPTADAGGPYSADEFSGQVDYNGWRVSLDGSGSSDPTSPTNRLSYLWDMGRERFDGTVMMPGKWIVSASGVSQSDALAVAGSGSWGTRYAFTRAPVQRAAGTAFEATVTPPATCHLMVGLKNTSTSYSYSEMPYAFYFHDSDYVEIVEGNSSRGRVALYTPGVAYDVRIDLKASAGARYFMRPSGADSWQLVYDSAYGTGSEFLRGMDVHSGTVLMDDLRECAPGQVAPWRFYGTNTFTATASSAHAACAPKRASVLSIPTKRSSSVLRTTTRVTRTGTSGSTDSTTTTARSTTSREAPTPVSASPSPPTSGMTGASNSRRAAVRSTTSNVRTSRRGRWSVIRPTAQTPGSGAATTIITALSRPTVTRSTPQASRQPIASLRQAPTL